MRYLFTMGVLLLTLVPAPLAQRQFQVGALAFGSPHTVSTLDMGKLKGEPARLSWSPDESELYLQTLDGGFGLPKAKRFHYVVALKDGARRKLDEEPGWAAAYWAQKSAQAAPGRPALKITLTTEQRRERTTSTPMGGDLARGSESTERGTTLPEAANAAYSSQYVHVHTMHLLGHAVGEFINSAIVPGLTFGWAPEGTGVLAFSAERTGALVVIDANGRTQEITGTKDTLLPAWTNDGTRLAWLQKDGRKKFLLLVVDVQAP